MSCTKPESSNNLDPAWVAGSARGSLISAQLWNSDELFRPYAMATFAIGRIESLSPTARTALSETRLLLHPAPRC